MELCSSNIKKFLTLSQKSCFYISGNKNPENIPYISGSNFPS